MMKTELKQNGSTTWVNVVDNLVVVSGPLENCEWYGSRRIVKVMDLGQYQKILILA